MNLASIFSWFASGPEAANKVLDAGIKGIDALVYTDEEKAVAKQKMVEGWVDLIKSQGEETTVRAITRRVLAFGFCFPFIILCLVAAGVYKVDQEYAKFLLEVANGQFGTLTLTVGAFYFGPYMISNLVKTIKA